MLSQIKSGLTEVYCMSIASMKCCVLQSNKIEMPDHDFKFFATLTCKSLFEIGLTIV